MAGLVARTIVPPLILGLVMESVANVSGEFFKFDGASSWEMIQLTFPTVA
jgi:hypothetical protein